IGYLQETLRWLDHWLRGRDTGIMREPMLRAWLPGGFTVSPMPDDRPGRWVSERHWPAPTIEPQSWWLGPSGLSPSPQSGHRIDLPSGLVVGSGAGEFMPIFSTERGAELSGDQTAEDQRSLVFDSRPLDAPIEMIGTPSVRLELEASEPVGQIVVR